MKTLEKEDMVVISRSEDCVITRWRDCPLKEMNETQSCVVILKGEPMANCEFFTTERENLICKKG